MPTPKPVAPDGDPPDNRNATEQRAPRSLDDRPDDAETTGSEDALPESLPARRNS
jgi:hypothetical protein